jgi:hypothetical protein
MRAVGRGRTGLYCGRVFGRSKSVLLHLLSFSIISILACPEALAQAPKVGDAGVTPNKKTADAAIAQPEEKLEPLPADHQPKIELSISPEKGLNTGDLVHIQITVDARATDDITIPDRSLGAFEAYKKGVRIEPLADKKQRFVFTLDLIALEPGEQTIPEITLRVVTGDGIVGGVKTQSRKVKINALLGNEPNAKPKEATQPVQVMQDDYTLLYVLGGLLAALLVALVTLLIARWWRKREKKLPPPPPPRPPWIIAIEKLQQLEREKPKMIEQGKGGEFVDRVSDVVREYLGGRFAGGHLAFTGLETTSSEMIAILRELRVEVNLLQEIIAFLFRCDLVKFAKVTPNQDEVDLVFAEAQEIVRNSTPQEPIKEQKPVSTDSDSQSARGLKSV